VYRLIAFDMDGTLISHDRPLSDPTRDALNALIRRGCHVVMATGRSLAFIRIHVPGVEFSGPQITYNGAVIADAATGRDLSISRLPEGMASATIDFLLDADIPPIACAIDRVYMDRRIPDPEDWVAPGRDGTFLEDMRQAPVEGLIKVVGESDEEAIARVRPRAHAEFDSSLYVTQTSHRLIEFLNPEASKGAALRQIAGWLGINREEIIAFGDSHNDIAMFEVAGLSIAMGNASDEVKEAADRVTLRSDEDGVVAVLRDLDLIG
jgi:Cof subfamily protein (haloacid dehalogenase superfamily)